MDRAGGGAGSGARRAEGCGLWGRELGKGNFGASAVGERRIWVTYVFTVHDAYREMRPAFGLAPLESVLGLVYTRMTYLLYPVRGYGWMIV